MSPPVKTVVLVSQVWMGHVPAYHHALAKAFAGLGWRVVDVRAEPPSGGGGSMLAPQRRSRLGLKDLLRAGLHHVGLLSRLRAVHWLRRVSTVVAEERRTKSRVAVFFVYLDGTLLESGFPGWIMDRLLPVSWGGIVCRPMSVLGEHGLFPGSERMFRARGCRVLGVLDDAFAAGASRAWPGRVVVALPEFADVSPPARDVCGLAELKEFAAGRRIVLLAGVVSEKKSVSLFLDVASRAWAAGESLAFAIVGPFSSAWSGSSDHVRLAPKLSELPRNCFAWLRPVQEGPAFNAWIDAADVVWVAYRDRPFKGNLLTKAAVFAKPVVAAEGGLMAEHVRRFQLGAVVPLDDPEAALCGVRLAARSANSTGDYAGYLRLHGLERLPASVEELARALLP